MKTFTIAPSTVRVGSCGRRRSYEMRASEVPLCLRRQLPELDDQLVGVVAVGGAVAGEVAGVDLLRRPREADAGGGEARMLAADVVDEERDVVRADVGRLRIGGERRPGRRP